MAPRKLAAGNWKMHGTLAAFDHIDAMTMLADGLSCDVLICPPAVLIHPMRDRVKDRGVFIGGQDCHSADFGAHTGDISAVQLRDVGVSHVIVGHSERRLAYGEDDALIKAKAQAAHRAGLVAIICLGESQDQRDQGQTLGVIAAQLAGALPEGATAQNTVIAYEPVWAIGTGRTPSLDEIAQVHAALRSQLRLALRDGANITILYGGSVKPANAADIFALPQVNGALVGGASLTIGDFGPIITALDGS